MGPKGAATLDTVAGSVPPAADWRGIHRIVWSAAPGARREPDSHPEPELHPASEARPEVAVVVGCRPRSSAREAFESRWHRTLVVIRSVTRW